MGRPSLEETGEGVSVKEDVGDVGVGDKAPLPAPLPRLLPLPRGRILGEMGEGEAGLEELGALTEGKEPLGGFISHACMEVGDIELDFETVVLEDSPETFVN